MTPGKSTTASFATTTMQPKVFGTMILVGGTDSRDADIPAKIGNFKANTAIKQISTAIKDQKSIYSYIWLHRDVIWPPRSA